LLILKTGPGSFDLYTTFEDVSFDNGVQPIDFCLAEAQQIVDIVLNDIDGSLDVGFNASKSMGTLISNSPLVMNFVDSTKCTMNEARCYNYCTDTCFRSMRYEVDSAGTEDYKLKLCQLKQPSNCIFVPGAPPTDDQFSSWRTNAFVVHLPLGKYIAYFVDQHGAMAWPSFVQEFPEEAQCLTNATHTVDLIMPVSTHCKELVRNNNAGESSLEPLFWLYRFGQISVAPGAGVSGSNAIVGTSDGNKAFVGQFVDTRCFRKELAYSYEISAVVKLVDATGADISCIVGVSGCPIIGIYTTEYGFQNTAQLSSDLFVDGYQAFTGIFDSKGIISPGDAAFLYVGANLPSGGRLFIDHLSMKALSTGDSSSGLDQNFCQDLVREPSQESNISDMWKPYGFGSVSSIEGSAAAVRYSGKVFGWMGFSFVGVSQSAHDCLTFGTSWTVSAQVKSLATGTELIAPCGTLNNCPVLRIQIMDAHGNEVVLNIARIYEGADANGFSTIQTTFSMPSEYNWDGSVENIDITFRDFSIGLDVFVQNFTFHASDSEMKESA
jgi:hypothetical protein